MKLKPLFDWILVRPIQDKETTEGGLFIPEDKDKPQRGEVLRIGPGRLRDDGNYTWLGIRPGDQILYSPYAAREISLGGERCLLIRSAETNIFAIIEGDE